MKNSTFKKFTGLITAMLVVLSVSAEEANTQKIKSVKEVYVNMKLSDASLIETFGKVESVTDFKFHYSQSDIKNNIKLNGNYTNATVADVLVDISKEAHLKFRQINNNISVNKLKRSEISDENSNSIEIQILDTVIKGKVVDNTGTPLPGVNVALKGTSTGVVTDFDGNFSISVPDGAVLVFSYIGFATQEVVVGSRTVIDITMQEDAEQLSEVIIIGSRSKPRTQLETAVPVDVINAKDLQNSPQVNVTQMLQYTAPSFHSTPQTISDGTDHIDPAALRGLGPDQTLVLVNGKRRHTSALLNVNGTVGRGTVGTDLNSIPAAAIKRIEVLRDGAAAQYGSDAIAGVINIVLKDDTEQVSVNYESGTNAPNAFGGPDGGNVPGDLIPDFDSDGTTHKLTSNFGFNIGDNGYVNVTGEYMQRGSTNRSGNYTGSPYPADYTGRKTDDEFYAIVRQNTGFVERQVMEIGNSALRNASAMINMSYDISPNAELYGVLGFNYRDGLSRGFYRFPSTQNRVVPQVYPDGFSPQIKSDINDNSFIIGAKGKIGEWNTDFSQTRGQNRFDFTIQNSINASLGSASPTSAYAGGFAYNQNTTNIDFSRTFDPGFTLNVAFGGEFRLENYQIFEGEEASYVNGGVLNPWEVDDNDGDNQVDTTFVAGSAGIQVFPGFQPQNALNKSRNNAALYADLEFEFTDEFLVGLATRYEDYSDFGDQFTWKLATRYKFSDNVTGRASISTGFRAPSLHQIYFNNLSTQFIDGNPVQVGTFNNESNVTRAFGISPLKAETSTNISAGVTTRFDNFSFTADFYNISIDDRIVVSGRFSPGTILGNGVDAGDILIPLGAGSAQFFTNAVSTTTTGLDLVGTYNFEMGDDRGLDLTLAANFTETEVDKDGNGNADINVSPALEGLESTVYNREEISRIEVAQPKSKIAFSARYYAGKFSATFRATRFGEIEYIHPSDGDPANWPTNDFTGEVESRDQVFSAKIVPDISFDYQLSDVLKLTAGAHNFLNVYPDMHQHSANVSSGRFLFSRRVQQFGVRGMYMYFRVGLNF